MDGTAKGFCGDGAGLTKGLVERSVREGILPFWQGLADRERGGYYGAADFYGKPNKEADKGGILHARILWTFSAAYRLFKDAIYKEHAARARRYLVDTFYDTAYGGLYWLADCNGQPRDDKKQFYAIAFGIYALSEYYRAVGDGDALALALALFDTTERYGLDTAAGGYIEARSRNWTETGDSRLSEKDLDAPKSMNTNLHVMEAYTNLLRACEHNDGASGSPAGITGRVRDALAALTAVTKTHIIAPDGHFKLFFDMAWRPLTADVSYGHDIEGSWLLYDAALAMGDQAGITAARDITLRIAAATLKVAIDHTHGGFLSGRDGAGRLHNKKEWWPQAEAVVGFYNAYTLSGDHRYLDAAAGVWDFLQAHFVDHTAGDWHNELSLDNVPDTRMPKAGFWKCPYHNARACFELLRRMGQDAPSASVI